jgi:hypothetical protein
MTPLEASELLNLVRKARKSAREAARFPDDRAASTDDDALSELIGWVHAHTDNKDDCQPPIGWAYAHVEYGDDGQPPMWG